MAELQLTIEDTSPLLRYSRNLWVPGEAEQDSQTSRYSQSTFFATETRDASMTFTFSGTEVGIYGARRGNHGRYEVTLDGELVTTGEGNASPDAFRAELWKPDQRLEMGRHEVTIRNRPTSADRQWLDVDYLVVKSTIGSVGSKLNVRTIQDTQQQNDSLERFEYIQSDSRWDTDPPSEYNGFLGGTGQILYSFTSTINSEMLLRFKATNHDQNPGYIISSIALNIAFLNSFSLGHAIALYGPTGPSYGGYTVRMNNQQEETFNAKQVTERHQQLLYFASGLNGEIQTLRVTFNGDQDTNSTASRFGVDFANIYQATTGQQSSSSGSGAELGIESTAPSPGLIFGVTFSSGVAFLMILSVVVIILHRRFGYFSFLSALPFLGLVSQPASEKVLPIYNAKSSQRSSVASFTDASEYPFSTSDFYEPSTRTNMSSVWGGRSTPARTEFSSSSSARTRKSKASRQRPRMVPVLHTIQDRSPQSEYGSSSDNESMARAPKRSRPKKDRPPPIQSPKAALTRD
ncbi:hypothetical protein FA15DRAFT_696663 [Coprinopsis marcescibilis]|uniref:Uncharacterized protein n=1 Tax=Coprinopsis marcescibilis TaxID=230819 RepID=A0A5C3KLA6_COPMA|nr:hypothetical protein FA15DRAFT_696663 [Coprinopsis marcescibilis]